VVNSYSYRGLVVGRDVSVEWHDTPQLWVAYFCGCFECPKGMGKTEAEAIEDLKEQTGYRQDTPTATGGG
jgi:hypothetical protein